MISGIIAKEMKRMSLAFYACTLFFVLPASHAIVIVNPTGDRDLDVANVQSALDENPGEIIKLGAGVFNFGTEADAAGRGTVTISSDSRIIGSGLDAKGRPHTKILGGNRPFHLIAAAAGSVSIQQIWFDGPQRAAIQLDFPAGTTVLKHTRS